MSISLPGPCSPVSTASLRGHHRPLRSRTFTRPSRRSALEHIARHIRTVTLNFPHSVETFLPPVIDSINGTEQTFVYMQQRQGYGPIIPGTEAWK